MQLFQHSFLEIPMKLLQVLLLQRASSGVAFDDRIPELDISYSLLRGPLVTISSSEDALVGVG